DLVIVSHGEQTAVGHEPGHGAIEAGEPVVVDLYPQDPDSGCYHSLGHGVGLEVHELPLLGRNGEEIVPGDVLAIEPGGYRKGFGGCRLEDLVFVTDDGFELLTDYPYDLGL
ncbi:MAG: M24 family metallopeptidase, partial [Actinobacteria bacterium]|nr:M24 family metallopeptidase [Actinomycetota bacterium]